MDPVVTFLSGTWGTNLTSLRLSGVSVLPALLSDCLRHMAGLVRFSLPHWGSVDVSDQREFVSAILSSSQPSDGDGLLLPKLEQVVLPAWVESLEGHYQEVGPKPRFAFNNAGCAANVHPVLFEEDSSDEHAECLWAAEAAEH